MRPDSIVPTARPTMRLPIQSLGTRVIALVFWVWVLALGLYLLVGGMTGHHVAPVITGLAILVVAVLLGAFIPSTWRSICVTEQELLVPKGYRTIRVLVQDVAGVGLLYMTATRASLSGRSVGWYSYAWTVDGVRVKLRRLPYQQKPRWQADGPAPKPSFWTGQSHAGNFDVVSWTDKDRLSRSPQGRRARLIYDRVGEIQGPTGFLATRARQKHEVSSSHESSLWPLAYWSPDGEIGLIPQSA